MDRGAIMNQFQVDKKVEPNDEGIKKAVVDQLCWDDQIDAAHIKVEVSDGIVMLSGRVRNQLERKAARMDASHISGVEKVSDTLQVNDDEPRLPADTSIEKNAAMALSYNPKIDPSGVSVIVDEGMVAIEGSTDALWKKYLIGDIISGFPGVIRITNNLGDARSLVTHPATTTHQRLTPEARAELGISDGLVRFSAGLEHPDDVVEDLLTALDAA